MSDRTVEQHASDLRSFADREPTHNGLVLAHSDTLRDAADALARLAANAERLRDALTAIRDLPGEYDLLTNAMAKAMWTYADRALASPPADTEQQ